MQWLYAGSVMVRHKPPLPAWPAMPVGVGAESDPCHVYIAIGNGLHGRSFLPTALPPNREFCGSGCWGRFDDCPPVLEYTSVSSTSTLMFRLRWPGMIQSAIPDIIGPAITTHQPHAAAYQLVGYGKQVLRRRAVDAFNFLSVLPPGALFYQFTLEVCLPSRMAFAASSPSSAFISVSSCRARPSCLSAVMRMPKPNSALSLKE